MAHLVIALLVALPLLGTQLSLFVMILRRVHVYRRELRSKPPGGMHSFENVLFPWFHWLLERLSIVRARDELVTRQLALDELEWNLGHDGVYLSLQRVGIVAPMLGVLITSFLFLTPGDVPDVAKMQGLEIFNLVRPLVTGVMCGALLAILNQVLVQTASWQLNLLRQHSRQWVDQHSDVRGDLMDAVKASEILKKSQGAVNTLHATADQHLQHAHAFRAEVHSIHDAMVEVKSVVKLLNQELRDLQPLMGHWRDVSTSVGEFVKSTTENGIVAFRRLEQAAVSVHSAIDKQVLPSLEKHAHFAASFAKVTENTDRFSGSLAGVCGQLDNSAEAYGRAWSVFHQSWDACVSPAHKEFQTRMATAATTSERLNGSMNALHGRLTRIAELIVGVEPLWSDQATSLTAAAASLKKATEEGIAPILELQRETASNWKEGAAELRQSLQQLSATAIEGTTATRRQVELIEQCSGTLHSHLQPLIVTLGSTIGEMQSNAKQSVESSLNCTDAVGQLLADLRAVPGGVQICVADLKSSINTFHNTVSNQLEPAAKSQSQSAGKLGHAIDTLVKSQLALAAGTSAIQIAIAANHGILESSSKDVRALHDAAERTKAASLVFAGAIEQSVAPSIKSVLTGADSLASSAKTLEGSVNVHLVPTAAGLQALIPVVQQLQEILNSLTPLTNLGPELQKLTTGVTQIERVIAALEQLPDRLLDESIDRKSRRWYWPFAAKNGKATKPESLKES